MNVLQVACSLWNNLFFAFAGLIGISLIVAIHEFGHFLFCKLFNVKTPSFSIGFGPRLITKKFDETEFAISAIPLGGYVEIAGSAEVAQGEQKDAHSRDDRSFASKPWYQKFLILIAGIAINILFAYTAIIILFMAGMPKTMLLYPINAQPIVMVVAPESPAAQAGLLPQDTIVAINDRAITSDNAASLVEEIKNSPDKEVDLTISRPDTTAQQTLNLQLGHKDFLGKTVGYAGFNLDMATLDSYSFMDAFKAGIALTNKLIYDSIIGLRYIFASGDTKYVQGPVKLIAGTMQTAKEGFKTYLLFFAYISLSLAILNLLPLPILDGGQIVFYTIEALMGRSLPDKVREYIHITCWLAFLALVLFLSYKDIKELISGFFK